MQSMQRVANGLWHVHVPLNKRDQTKCQAGFQAAQRRALQHVPGMSGSLAGAAAVCTSLVICEGPRRMQQLVVASEGLKWRWSYH